MRASMSGRFNDDDSETERYNTVEVAKRVKIKLKDLEKILPADIKMTTIFDTSQDIIDSLTRLSLQYIWDCFSSIGSLVFLRQFLRV